MGVRLKHVDSLRGIAVMAVLLFHFFPRFLPGGFLGVDVFFVISGFVITRSLQDHSTESLGSCLRGFYIRRIKRLGPALLVVLCITSIFASAFAPRSLPTGIAALFGLANIQLWLSSSAYFGLDTDYNPFTHTWSLGVEEQYYLLYPAIFVLCARKRLVIGALSLISLAIFLQWQSFYLLPGRFWELGVGCLLQLAPVSISRKTWPLAVTTLTLAFSLPAEMAAFTTPLAVLSAACLICSGLPSIEGLRQTGLASYSIYLWHWPILVFAKYMVTPSGSQLAILMGGAIAVGFISYRIIERGSISPNIALSTLAATVALASYVYAPAQASERLDGSACNLTPHLLRGDSWRPRPNIDDAMIDGCVKASSRSRKIILVGDSFANRLRSVVSQIANENGYEFGVIFGYGCPLPLNQGLNCNGVDPDHLRERILTSLRRGDILVFRAYLSKPQYRSRVDTYDSALDDLKAQVESRGASLLIVGSNHIISPGAPDTIPRDFNRETTLFFEIDEHLSQRYGSDYLSLVPQLCPDRCIVRSGGVEYFTDNEHLSQFAISANKPQLSGALTNLTDAKAR